MNSKKAKLAAELEFLRKKNHPITKYKINRKQNQLNKINKLIGNQSQKGGNISKNQINFINKLNSQEEHKKKY